MRTLRYILQKEFLQIFTDRSILAMMFVMPTLQLIIIPLAMDFDVKNINIVIVDNDHSSLSQKLVTRVGASGYFRYTGAASSYQKALPYIENGATDVIMEIPAGFERNLVRTGIQKIAISIDGINGIKAALGAAHLQTVIAGFNKTAFFVSLDHTYHCRRRQQSLNRCRD
ncbi:MAG TPA: ABC transporter permease, partial [Agriterribacter sp.]|nr:ABC transporter permease [Agriterribacter sp.]